MPALIHRFIERENERPWRELYLLTGRKTFSAGIMLAQGFMDNVDVSIVGEPMGRDTAGDSTGLSARAKADGSGVGRAMC